MNDLDLLQVKATYFGLISEVDQNLGKVINYLKESGQYDSTLVVFTSDHGEHLGDHYLFGKLGYFDQGYHIPLIVMDPEISPKYKGTKFEVFTESIDVMPTILDWLDAEIPEECDGSSLLPLMYGTIPNNWRTEAHWEYDFRLIGTFQPLIKQKFGLSPDQCSLSVIRDDHFKYVHMTALPPLLFDLENDPEEFVNLASHPDFQKILVEYSGKMLSWNMLHRDRTLVNINLESGSMVNWKGPRVLDQTNTWD